MSRGRTRRGKPEAGKPVDACLSDGTEPFTRFIAEVLSELRKRPGYRSLEVLNERETGDVRVVSMWDDPTARPAAAEAFLPVLQRAAEFQLRPIAIEEPWSLTRRCPRCPPSLHRVVRRPGAPWPRRSGRAADGGGSGSSRG
jgi:hypothetical protein